MIKILSDDTINKISAGEVVERPASIVKELIENSIDAGASEIAVEVKSGGKNLIRVADNGQGMDKDDAVLSIERHATSKITTIDDLGVINTFGFRGEALSSIAGISRMVLVTKTNSLTAGTRVVIEGGRIEEVKETGATSGTVVSVQNVFFNTPARRKFLKSDTTEFSHIITVFSNYAIAYTDREFKLIHNENSAIEILKRDALLDRIGLLYGNETKDSLNEIDYAKDGVRVRGFASLPHFSKPNRTGQFIFVNKRPITSRTINYAIYEGYDSLLPRGRFPVVFLFIEVNPSDVDINVHPAKREVRFADERLVKEAVTEGLRRALQNVECGVRSANTPSPDPINPVGVHPFYKKGNTPEGIWGIREQGATYQGAPGEWKEEIAVAQQEGFSMVQVNNSYIIKEVTDGFEIIDQHAAHERILYEKIKEGLQKKESLSQRLLIPLSIELSSGEYETLKQELSFFRELGFNIEEFGRDSVIVDMIPAALDKVDVSQLIKDILSELKDSDSSTSQDDVRDNMIKVIACHTAIKQGDKLDILEIKRLITEWKKLPLQYTCPHGRPAVIKMTKDELDKRFQRT